MSGTCLVILDVMLTTTLHYRPYNMPEMLKNSAVLGQHSPSLAIFPILFWCFLTGQTGVQTHPFCGDFSDFFFPERMPLHPILMILGSHW